MRKTILIVVALVAALTLGGVGIVSAQSLIPVQGLIANASSVYAEPSDSGEALGDLAAGTVVSVLRSTDNQAWYEVETGAFAGYVAAEDVVLLPPALLGQLAWAASPTAGVAIFAGPNLNSELLSTMSFGQSVLELAAYDEQWAVVQAPDGTLGFALASALEPLAEGSAPAVVTTGAADAAGLFADADLTSDVVGSLPPGEMVYTLGEPDGRWVEVLTAGGDTGFMMADQLILLPDAVATVSVGASSAGVYAEPDLMADVLGQLDDGATVYVLGSVDEFWMNIYAPGIGMGYVRKDNLASTMVVGTVTYANALVRQGPNDSIYRAIAELPAGTEVVVTGTSANGAWYQVYVPYEQIDYPYNGLAGWINATLVSVDASALEVTE